MEKVVEVPQLGSTTQGSVREVDVETEPQTQALTWTVSKRVLGGNLGGNLTTVALKIGNMFEKNDCKS